MKRIICVVFLLISINVLGQDIEGKNKVYIGIEAYRGYNNMNDFFKEFTGKTINRDNIYLRNGWSIKLYDYLFTDMFPVNKHPFKLSTGFTLFNIGKGNVVSIPLNLRADARLSNRIRLSANIGGRYFANANNDFNNKIFLEYGFDIRIRIFTFWTSFGIGWSVIQKANFSHLDLPIYPIFNY